MIKRALAIVALSLLFVWPGGAQTPPVINGQTGAVTISPQTLEWLRQRLAEEEERLRQLQIAIQQIARAVAASQVTAQPLVPTPAEAAIPATPPISEPPLAAVPAAPATGAAPLAAIPAAAPIVPHPPLIPVGPRPTPTASRPPLIPAPLRREPAAGPERPATAATPPASIYAPPTAPLLIPESPGQPVAAAPPAGEPAGPVSITPPPAGPPMPTVVIDGTAVPRAETVAPPGTEPPAPGRRPSILIPTFTPHRPPSSVIDRGNDSLDDSGSPVMIPPDSPGDDLVIPEGIVGSNAVAPPAALPSADLIRPGLSMAEVRGIKGTPALISRDEAAGTETWTYPDGTLIFRAGHLTTRRVDSVEAPLRAPGAAPNVASARPVPTRTSPMRKGPGETKVSEETIIPSATPIPTRAATAPKTAVVNKVAGHRQKMQARSRAGKRVANSRSGKRVAARRHGRSMTARRTARSARFARAQQTRRWAWKHRRAHARALRRETPRVRTAAMNACRKCRTARAALFGPRRTHPGRVAAWRATMRGKPAAATASKDGVKIIQRE